MRLIGDRRKLDVLNVENTVKDALDRYRPTLVEFVIDAT